MDEISEEKGKTREKSEMKWKTNTRRPIGETTEETRDQGLKRKDGMMGARLRRDQKDEYDERNTACGRDIRLTASHGKSRAEPGRKARRMKQER
jgi:hypothetical protein